MTLTALTMPRWGMTMAEGTLTGWLAGEGQRVAAGDEVCEIETTKIANVLEAPASGVLRRRVAAAGDTLPVGALLGVIDDGEAGEAELDAFVAERAREAAAAEADGPPAPRLLGRAGARLNVLTMGEGGVPAVLLPGFGGGPDAWGFVQPGLAAERAVHAVPLPGHGGSEPDAGDGGPGDLAARVAAVLEALDAGPAHLVGHSLGGAVALRLAADRPDLVRSLALIAPAGFGPEIGPYVGMILEAERRREVKAALQELLADPALVSRAMVEEVQRARRMDGAADALRAIAAAAFPGGRQAIDLRAEWAALSVPRLVIWGAADRVVPPEHAAGLEAVMLEGAGHLPQLEAAAEVERRLAAHFRAADGG